MTWPFFSLLVLLAVSAVAALTDVRTGRIPNALTFPAALAGVVLHVLASGGAGALWSAAGLLVSAAVPWLLHRTTGGRAIGGGDVKLFAALGALGGPSMGLQVELSAFFVLAAFALVRLAFQGVLLRVLLGAFQLALRPLFPRSWRASSDAQVLTGMRMGPAIAMGALSVLVLELAPAWVSWLA